MSQMVAPLAIAQTTALAAVLVLVVFMVSRVGGRVGWGHVTVGEAVHSWPHGWGRGRFLSSLLADPGGRRLPLAEE